MIRTLFQNEIVKVEFDEEQSLFKHTWNDKTAKIDNETYQSLVTLVTKHLNDLPEVHYHLVDTSEFAFIIIPELQEWVANLVFPIVEAKKGKKLAFLISKELFPQISIEQFTDENPYESFQIAYFKTEEEALEWLFAS